MEKVISLTILLFGISNAIIRDGMCPDTNNIKNFVLIDLEDKVWYEYIRYPNEIQPDDKNTAYEGVIYKNGYKLKAYDILEDSQDFRQVILQRDANEYGDIEFEISYGKPRPQSTLTLDAKVLFYDPDSFVLFYACCYDVDARVSYEYAWLFTREEKIDIQTQQALKSFIEYSTYGLLDYNKFLFYP